MLTEGREFWKESVKNKKELGWKCTRQREYLGRRSDKEFVTCSEKKGDEKDSMCGFSWTENKTRPEIIRVSPGLRQRPERIQGG